MRCRFVPSLALSSLIALPAIAQQAAPSSETITVTATRTESRLGDTAASVVVLNGQAIANSPGLAVDESLRAIPGFTLFRRTGSRTANPTSQGVSLRGIGASGASRALVLDDGVPLNDAFGGWIYWGRIPRLALERAEVLRGGGSELYGSAAMSGVVQFVRRRNVSPALSIDLSGGSQGTSVATTYAAGRSGPVSGALAAEWFETWGYHLIDDGQRGAVDRPADSRHVLVEGTVGQETPQRRLFLRGSLYDEQRNNGTVLQVNETSLRSAALGGDLPAAGGTIIARLSATDQEYQQTFSAIASGRGSERLTVSQVVPSRSVGANAHYYRAVGSRHVLLAGGEARRIRGESREDTVSPLGVPIHAVSGGRQRLAAAFIEDLHAIVQNQRHRSTALRLMEE